MLNPRITKESNGNYTLRWTPDLSVDGYSFTTPRGSSRTFNPALDSTNLGKGLTEPVKATVTPLMVEKGTAESAQYPASGPTGATGPTGPTGATGSTGPSGPAPTPSPAKTGAGMMRWGGVTITSNTDKFGWVFAAGGTEYAVAKLPNAFSITYKSILSASTKTDGRNYGLTGQEALAKGWVMLDAAGNPMRSESYQDSYLLDLGNKSMQQALAANVVQQGRDVGIDGIFFDDAVAQGRGYATTTPAKYPNDQAWEDAMVDALATVGAAVRAAGFYVVANVYKRGGQIATADFANRAKAGMNGAMFEYWPQFDDSVDGAKKLQTYGIDLFGLNSASPYDKPFDTSLNAFLAAWNGKTGAFVYAPPSGDGWGAWTSQLAYH
jgi:hypothetical protein